MISRRELLSTLVAMTIGARRGLAQSAHGLLYVGTYTKPDRPEGIYVLRVDSHSGELHQVDSVNAGANPSFLTLHPNGRVLYAVNEVDKGAVGAFAIGGDSGALTRLNDQSSEGRSPCYVSLDRNGRALFVANYSSGTVALLPIQSNGSLSNATSVTQHTGSGPNAARQKAPHAHSIITDPSNRFALAADLGADRVFLYRVDGNTLHRVETGDAIMRPGAGPRHMAFHPTRPLVFVANELDSTVTTLRFDADKGALSSVATRATILGGWKGTNYPADIHVASSGRTVYVSNRGHNSISVFSVAQSNGALTLDQVISSEGDWPRNFTLDPTEQWLLVANQRSDSIVVFRRDKSSGQLTATGQRLAIPSPVCLRFALR